MHVLRDTGCGVKGDRSPHCVDVLLGDVVLTKKLTSSVGSVYLKTICSAAVFRSETHIMEHCTHIQQLRIEGETFPFAGCSGKIVDAVRRCEKKRFLGPANHFVPLGSHFAVGDGYTRRESK